jgi:hypothetical protein
MLLAALCKSPGHAWNDADITELLNCRHKSLLGGDLNAKHTFWNPSGLILLNLLHINEFKISAPQCPPYNSPEGNGDVLDIVVHRNVRMSLIFWTQITHQSFSTC